MCFNTHKTALLSGFSPPFLFAINWANLAFRMTIIKNTHLTLAVIPFKVEANNNFFAIRNIREKICRVSVPLQSIIPWLEKLIFTLYISTLCKREISCDNVATSSIVCKKNHNPLLNNYNTPFF